MSEELKNSKCSDDDFERLDAFNLREQPEAEADDYLASFGQNTEAAAPATKNNMNINLEEDIFKDIGYKTSSTDRPLVTIDGSPRSNTPDSLLDGPSQPDLLCGSYNSRDSLMSQSQEEEEEEDLVGGPLQEEDIIPHNNKNLLEMEEPNEQQRAEEEAAEEYIRRPDISPSAPPEIEAHDPRKEERESPVLGHLGHREIEEEEEELLITSTSSLLHSSATSHHHKEELLMEEIEETITTTTTTTREEEQRAAEEAETPPNKMAETPTGRRGDEYAEIAQESCQTCRFHPSVWLNPSKLDPRVADLIYWRDVKKTGVAFGASFLVLLSLTYFSLISVVAYILLAVMTGTLSYRVYKNVLQAVQKSNEGHPFKVILDMDVTLPQEKVHEMADLAVKHVNCTVHELRRLFLVEDLVDSIKFAVMLWCFTYIGAWFNGLTLVILAFVSLFTLPKVYETYKEQIDHYVGLVFDQVNDVVNKIKAKIPVGKKTKQQ